MSAKQGSDDFLAAGHTLADFDKYRMERWPDQATSDNTYTDAMMAEAVADDVLRGRYNWSNALGWLRWDGVRWVGASDKSVREEVRLYIVGRYAEEAKKAHQFAMEKLHALQSKNRLTAVTDLATALVEVDPKEFDSDADLLNCANGVVDLRTGELLPHDPDLMMRKLAPTNYLPGARHNDWDMAQTAFADTDVRDYMQIRFGQAITGYRTPDDITSIQKGGGRNGKTTITEPMANTLGDYFVTPSDEVLMPKNGHPTSLMSLLGARMVMLEETTEAAQLDEQRLKKLTSRIRAHFMHKDEVEFAPTHTLFVNTNYRINVSSVDDGTWERLEEVPYPFRYRKPHEAIEFTTDRRGDGGLRPRLIAGGDGRHEAILAWLVAGAMTWYADGRIMPPQPSMVRKTTRQWRKESDMVLGLWDELIIADRDCHIWTPDLLTEVNQWLQGNGKKPISDTTFRTRFEPHAETKGRFVYRKKVRKSVVGEPTRPPQTMLGRFEEAEHPQSHPPRKAVPVQYNAWMGVRFRTLADGVADDAEDEAETVSEAAGNAGNAEKHSSKHSLVREEILSSVPSDPIAGQSTFSDFADADSTDEPQRPKQISTAVMVERMANR